MNLLITLWIEQYPETSPGVLYFYKWYPNIEAGELDQDYARDQNLKSLLTVRKFPTVQTHDNDTSKHLQQRMQDQNYPRQERQAITTSSRAEHMAVSRA